MIGTCPRWLDTLLTAGAEAVAEAKGVYGIGDRAAAPDRLG